MSKNSPQFLRLLWQRHNTLHASELNEHAGALIKTTLVDFPGRVACSFFLRGCNMRCPYCYNTGLVIGGDDDALSSVNELFMHLEKRRSVLSGLVISGGEPLANKHTLAIIEHAKALGYKIKLDTNGTFPDKLESIIKNDKTRPDFIAMDIKTNPTRYGELFAPCCKTRGKGKAQTHAATMPCNVPASHTITSKHDYPALLARSVQLIASLPGNAREWRTVLVPHFVKKDDIAAMAALLPKDASWQFAQFRNENCLDASYNDMSPYTDDQAAELVTYAKTLVEHAALR